MKTDEALLYERWLKWPAVDSEKKNWIQNRPFTCPVTWQVTPYFLHSRMLNKSQMIVTWYPKGDNIFAFVHGTSDKIFGYCFTFHLYNRMGFIVLKWFALYEIIGHRNGCFRKIINASGQIIFLIFFYFKTRASVCFTQDTKFANIAQKITNILQWETNIT